MLRIAIVMLLSLLLLACDHQPWNSPYPASQTGGNIRYNSFDASPKTLDPAKSYSVDETIFIEQIYEPPLQYHFLKRPFTLVPLTTASMPKISYFDANHHQLAPDAKVQRVAFTVYDLELKPGIYYQPHPAFAKTPKGDYRYHQLQSRDLRGMSKLQDFKYTGTRELTADDYVYEIKRLGNPAINSSIFGLMATKIVGLGDFASRLAKLVPGQKGFLDLRNYPLAGAQVIDRYHYRIILKGKYPQFLYWLAMPFFVPIPWEVDLFYSQPGMAERNFSLDWYPVGTGPYMLIENDPNRQMVLQKNPFFHPEYFPSEGERGDKAAGFLQNAGQRLPFIEKAVFALEKESIPRWNKFLQGYYDQSAISSDSFDQAIQIDDAGNPSLTAALKTKGIYLQTTVTPSIYYIGFNMRDDVVGGGSARARKLRLAISIAVDFDEYINIFLNGRGVPAQGPIPPGIFGYRQGPAGINPLVYDWTPHGLVRKQLADAKQLMVEAGYSGGIDPKTGQPLILNYDVATTSGPEDKSVLDWLRQQFAKLGIQLNIRATEYNRFQEEVRLGQAQIFMWGWLGDYPDPENFLSLLYGPNSKVLSGGENNSNYHNATFDKLFDQMKTMANTNQRLEIIDQMLTIVRYDAPWVWGFNPKSFVLNNVWNQRAKPNAMTPNTLKYQRLDPKLRVKLRFQWNQKILWPIWIILVLAILIALPVVIRFLQQERRSIK